MSCKKYLLIQTAIGDYRQNVINQLEDQMEGDLQICCGEIYFDSTTKTRINFNSEITKLKNYYFFNRKALFQSGCFFQSLCASNVILEMNPRIINTWLIAIIRRLLCKPVVMWGHAWPREGKYASTDKLRSILRGLATQLIVYTETQKTELKEKEPALTILVAPNSLYSSEQMSFATDTQRDDFIYVGRLVKSKKVSLLIKAFIEFKEKNESNQSCLIIVGDGPERTICNSYLDEHNKYKDFVKFKGHVSNVEQLRQYYSTSISSVSPGYVGLSITQSFAFGVPMIISSKENHSPEIEAALPEVNAVFFESDNVSSLANKLEEAYCKRVTLAAKGIEIVENCKKSYSTDVMAKRLALALRLAPEYSPDNRKSIVVNMVRTYIRKLRILRLKFTSHLRVGKNVSFGKSATIQSPEYCNISSNFSAGANFFVQTNLTAGDDCLISSNVSFVGNDHDLNHISNSMYWSGKNKPSLVSLAGNNFIGFGATIIGDVTVGKGAAVGAGSVVINDVEPNTLVAGVPAKYIKDLK